MKTMRMWQITVMVPMVLVLAGSGQVQGDFRFGEPANLGSTINSSDSEYDPDISTDGLELYFQSPRSGGYGDSDIYVTTRATTDDQWSEPVNLGPIINSSGTEFGPNISADGLSLYFNSTRPGGSGQNDLYVTTRKTVLDPWGEPLNLGPIVNTSFHDVNPNITADGLSLFFSDWDGATPRPGGYGQCDIWMTRRASLSEPWSSPVNLGPQLNGPLVEGAPDISNDGRTLFFSGYLAGADWDLWFATQNIDATWGAPVNLGPPVNSGSDPDICPCISADGRMLYFSSFRSGGNGNSDIWQVQVIPTVDLNSDGIVDSADMCIMVDHWGQNEPLCDIGPTPLGDGIVDAHDLVVLAEHLFEETLPLELVAYWRLDEAEGDIAYNSIGDNHGILIGNPTWQPDSGQVAGALQFDGIDDYVETDFVLNPTDGRFSVFAWIKADAPGQVVLSQIGGANWLSSDPSEGKLMTELGPPVTRAPIPPMLSDVVITDDDWHHIGLVWYGSFRALYVDGANVAEDAIALTQLKSANGGLYIGTSKTLDAETFFSGMIDDVRIYDKALNPEQIEAIAR
ncbi:LamG-like jellyroll fold domain-containing protein [Planctomycetota bacterium]